MPSTFRKTLAFGIAASLLFSTLSYASEPDSFTHRPTDPASWQDHSAQDALNRKTEELFSTALTQVKGCDLHGLHMAIKNSLAGGEIGRLEYWALREPTLKKVVVPYDQSIYADAGLKTGSKGLALMGIVPSFVIGGHYVGADKLGHFFDQGYDYFEEVYIRHGDTSHAIEAMGLEDEESTNGMAGNGIRSYADMAANFGGYLFWREVTTGPHPYFSCVDGKYLRTNRKFDWAEYATDAWDEAINCSEFNDGVNKAVSKALGKLKTTCPIRPEACQTIVAMLCGTTYLSPACLPYVQLPSYPDSACLKLMRVDQSDSQACYYPIYPERIPMIKTSLDWIDGAKTLVKMKSDQASDWTRQTQERAQNAEQRAYQEMIRVWRKLRTF